MISFAVKLVGANVPSINVPSIKARSLVLFFSVSLNGLFTAGASMLCASVVLVCSGLICSIASAAITGITASNTIRGSNTKR